jgi:serine/threonine-protein kinase
MGDDASYRPPPRSPVLPAVVASIVTTAALFFGLRALDQRGLLPGGAKPVEAPPPVSAAAAPGPAPAAGPVDVPSVIGMHTEQARELLRGRGLLLTFSIELEDPLYPAGTIAAQTPLPGSQLPKGAAVEAVISRGGPPPKPIPKLTGLRLRAAKELLEQQGFKLGKVRYGSDDDRSPGVVLDQKPAAATSELPGTVVDLTVNED